MTEWGNVQEAAPYAWTGAAGILGRLMYHAREVQRGKRKPLTWALLMDLPIALGMGWTVYGIMAYAQLGTEPAVSAAIVASYLGPYAIDRIFALWSIKYFDKKGGDNATD